jgi:hypothetical protein
MSWGSISAASHHRRHGPASADALRARRFTRECPWSFRDEATSRPLRGLGTSGGSRLGPLPASYPASRARVHSRDRTEPIREVSKGKSDKIRTFAEGALMSQGSRDRALASATPHSTASARLPSPTDFPEHLLGTVAWLEGREARIGYVSRHFGGHPLTSMLAVQAASRAWDVGRFRGRATCFVNILRRDRKPMLPTGPP